MSEAERLAHQIVQSLLAELRRRSRFDDVIGDLDPEIYKDMYDECLAITRSILADVM